MSNRRAFLKASAIAMYGIGSAPAWLGRAVAGTAGSGKRKKTLVAIFQRGAADGLNIVVPYGERRYYELRPQLAVPRGQELALDGRFGLHPSLAALKPIFEQKRMAIVEAVGSPDPTRSHFDAQAYMESATPGRKATSDGWLNRALLAEAKPSPVRGVAIGNQMALAMKGSQPAVSLTDIGKFQVQDARGAGSFESMYSQAADRVMQEAGKETFDAIQLLESIQKEPYQPVTPYPNTRFGRSLQQIARLVKAGVGVEVAFADMGGWDHHVNQTPQLTNMLRDFGNSIAAFYRDLEDRMDDVVIVTMSEFGRTARENGTRGTDHGHANVMFALGGPVNGGKVLGDWPGLEAEQLYEGRDLAVTTDFRDVLAEVVVKHLWNRQLEKVFPGHKVEKRVGLLRG
jgi:uncharacterized protein (DUF1501 family)